MGPDQGDGELTPLTQKGAADWNDATASPSRPLITICLGHKRESDGNNSGSTMCNRNLRTGCMAGGPFARRGATSNRTQEAKVASFNWTPGIGDPTFVGWLTVALYFAASISCWVSGRKMEPNDRRHSNERHAWRSIAVLFLALGINKQLDLQTALTEAGRVVAHIQGWYENRQPVQIAFIGLVAMACVIVASTLLIWMRHAPIPTWLALIGTTLVLGYVLIRAASFHHIDRFIAGRISH